MHPDQSTAAFPPGLGQRGFTLIEILVTVLIVSLGLLGMAALQIGGIRNDQNAYYRTVADQIAYDVADRLRANAAWARAGHYDGTDTDNAPAAPPACAAGVVPCSPQDMVTYDQRQWADLFANPDGDVPLLPHGRITIQSQSVAPEQYRIAVSWGRPASSVNMVMQP